MNIISVKTSLYNIYVKINDENIKLNIYIFYN